MDSNRKTDNLIRDWSSARQRVERLTAELDAATVNLVNAEAALGEHLCPGDAEPFQSFNIWANGECVGLRGDVLVTVTFNGGRKYNISARQPKPKAA